MFNENNEKVCLLRSQLRPNIHHWRTLSPWFNSYTFLELYINGQTQDVPDYAMYFGRLDGQVKVCQPILLGSMNLHFIMAIYSGYVYEKL